MYYTAELQNGASYRKAEPTKSKTLAGAKRTATQRQTFLGTALAVYNSYGRKIAIKDHKSWYSLPCEEPLNCAPDFDPQD